MIRREAASGKAGREGPLITHTCRVMGTVVSFTVAPGTHPRRPCMAASTRRAPLTIAAQHDHSRMVWPRD